jgi:hypothetical protein
MSNIIITGEKMFEVLMAMLNLELMAVYQIALMGITTGCVNRCIGWWYTCVDICDGFCNAIINIPVIGDVWASIWNFIW